ncbi:MAG TPA: cell division protein FtsZ [Candidatus Deferrimicrobium sp.]|nr:cell division protein FtsZ [Candidatus Deferrimicrobium sp.]
MQSFIETIVKEEREKTENIQPEIQRQMDDKAFKSNDVDFELEEILRQSRARILVVGVGGAGNNAITRLMEVGIRGAQTLAVNTDAQDLLYTISDKKLLIGRKLTHGLGAGNNPKIGEAAAQESIEQIKQALNADMVFITCGLGGGTGTGAAPLMADLARQNGALTISICTLPFEVEGPKKKENATFGLEKLAKASDTIIILPNEKLLDIAPDLSLPEAFHIIDEILIQGAKNLTELITNPGFINLDFADVRNTLRNSGEALIGIGQANKAVDAALNALNNPLIDVDYRNAKKVLLNVSSSNSLSLQETESIIRTILQELNSDVEVKWGTVFDPDLKNNIRVTAIISGINSNVVKSSQEPLGKAINFDPDPF